MYLNFLVCRKACFVRGTHFPATGAQTRCEHREVYCSARRIDPSPSTVLVPMAMPKVLTTLNLARQMPSNDHGGDGACIDQVVVPTVPRRPSACGSPPCSERAPSSQAPQIPSLSVETFCGVREGGASQRRRLPHLRGQRQRQQGRDY